MARPSCRSRRGSSEISPISERGVGKKPFSSNAPIKYSQAATCPGVVSAIFNWSIKCSCREVSATRESKKNFLFSSASEFPSWASPSYSRSKCSRKSSCISLNTENSSSKSRSIKSSAGSSQSSSVSAVASLSAVSSLGESSPSSSPESSCSSGLGSATSPSKLSSLVPNSSSRGLVCNSSRMAERNSIAGT